MKEEPCIINSPYFCMTTGEPKNTEWLQRQAIKEYLMLTSGQFKLCIPLNGGSQTRRDVYLDYKEKFPQANYEVQYLGYCIIVKHKTSGQEAT